MSLGALKRNIFEIFYLTHLHFSDYLPTTTNTLLVRSAPAAYDTSLDTMPDLSILLTPGPYHVVA